jgi:hypothetical protein
MKPGDLVFVECGFSIAMGSHRCDEECPARGLATVIDTEPPREHDRGVIQVLDAGGLKWIDLEDCTADWVLEGIDEGR